MNKVALLSCDDVETLARENRRLRESLQQSKRIQGMLDKAVAELQAAKAELSTLYRVSMALRDPLGTDEICRRVLDIMGDALALDASDERGIFLVEGNSMKVAARLPDSPEFRQVHEGMKVGSCLCGSAAESGDIIVTRGCNQDVRHTLPWNGDRAHGHVVIPLTAQEKVVGVFYCYLPESRHFEGQKRDLFRSIGDQVGVAIENARLYERIQSEALHDNLTGLENRRSMDHMLHRLLAEAKRYRTPFSVIMGDIDYFKRYNDTFGHQAGDALLRSVADIFKQELRVSDMAVRYGGEEFLLILPKTPLAEACSMAERLRDTVKAITPVTISFGVAAFHADTDLSETLIDRADAALYEAKRSGRNRIAVMGEFGLEN